MTTLIVLGLLLFTKLEQEEYKSGCIGAFLYTALKYAGISFVAGYISTAFLFEDPLWIFTWKVELITILFLVIPTILGGAILGILSNKWWIAIIGGVIANVSTIFLMLILLHLGWDVFVGR